MSNLGFFGLLCLLTLLILETGNCRSTSLSETYYAVPTLPPQTTTTKRNLKCVCDDDDQPVCASNGVTYPSNCRFQCAKRRVPRLRIVKPGDCGSSMTKQKYWSSGQKTFRRF